MPRLHVALCRMALGLDCLDLVVGKPAPDVRPVSPCTQGLALWPVDRGNGALAVDVQREQVHGDCPCRGSSVVLATARSVCRQHVDRHRPMGSRLEVPQVVDCTAQPNRRIAPLPEEEPSVNKCPSRSPCG